MSRKTMTILMLMLLAIGTGEATARGLTGVSATTKCPVCGMFVGKYPDWTTQVKLRDGSAAFFDGAKDMFTFIQGVRTYMPTKNAGDIAEIVVQDYYALSPIDGRKAYYVIGSDIYGPMGKELIPFGKKADAQEFLKDHKGKKIVTFRDVSAALLKTID